MRYAVRNTPRGANLYPAAGAVGREAPGGTTEMVTLLRKSGEGAGEPSGGRRWRVWVSLTDGAGAETAWLAASGAYCTPRSSVGGEERPCRRRCAGRMC